MLKLLLPDTAATAFTKKERILFYLFLFFFVALYMPGISWLYNLAMWLLFVYALSCSTIPEKIALLRKRPAIWLIMLFFLANLLSALLSANLKEGISWVGIRISLLTFPLSIGTLLIRDALKDRIIFGFVAATGCAGAVSLVYGIVRVVSRSDWSMLYNDNLSDIVNLQSIYFAMLINIAILGIGYLQFRKPFVTGKYFTPGLLLVLLPVHFLLASRIAIIILYSLILLFALYAIVQQKKLAYGLLLLAGLLLSAGLLFLVFPKTINRFKEIGYTHFNYGSTAKESHFNSVLTADQWNGANIRMAVWACAWDVTKQHFLFGVGLGDKMDELKKQYARQHFIFGLQTNRNVHNTYLDIWLSLGLAGLLLFLGTCFVCPGLLCMQTGDWFGGLVLACLFIAMFTETYLDRTVGNTILSFFLSFTAAYKKPAG